MLTEAEAKTKWCPMSRYAVAVGPAGDVEQVDNRTEPRAPVCIGSACMMWRSGGYRNVLRGDGTGTTDLVATGFCGLAGSQS